MPDAPDRDTGVRYAGIDAYGGLDVLSSNESSFSMSRFEPMTAGHRAVSTGKVGS